MVASFGEECGATVLTRGSGGGGGVRTTVVAHAASDREGSGGGQRCRACPFYYRPLGDRRALPGWLIGMRHVATQRPTGGLHMSAKFQFLEILENMFPRSKNR
jgi:hypothetical protein